MPLSKTNMPSVRNSAHLQRWSSRLRSNSNLSSPTSPTSPRTPSHAKTLSSPSIMSFSEKESFGLPVPDDPDPFGVRALEELGLEIKEAGSKRRVSLEVFEYRPSPTSPIFPLFSSRQSTDLSRRNSNQSVKSLNRFLRNSSTDVTSQPPPTIPEAPREEPDHRPAIRPPSFLVESPTELPTTPALTSSPLPSAIPEEDESSSQHSSPDDPFAGFSDYDTSSETDASDDEFTDDDDDDDSYSYESEPEEEAAIISAPTTIIAQGPALSSRPRIVTIPPKRAASASNAAQKRLSTSQKRLSVSGKPKLPRRSSRRVAPSEMAIVLPPPQPVTPELVSDSASIESAEKSSSARTSVDDGRKEGGRRVSQELYGGFVGDAGNPWLEEEVHAGFVLGPRPGGKEVRGVDVGGQGEREVWHEAPSSPVR